jgi:hypothetical protein
MANQFNTPTFFSNEALGTEVIFKCPFINNAIQLYFGTGKDQFMTIDSDDVVMRRVNTDGSKSVALVGADLHGGMLFAPGSPVIDQLNQIVQGYNKYGVLAGIGQITFKGKGFNYTLTGVTIKKPFKGFAIGKILEDVGFDFDANIPVDFAISDLINAAGGLINF